MSPGVKLIKKLTLGLLNFRHMVLIGSALFFIIVCIAIYLIYQDAKVMRELIYNDFNQQQLVLARQAAQQIGSHLSDIETEVELLIQRSREGLTKDNLSDALKAVLERTEKKGLIEMGLIGDDNNILYAFSLEGVKPVELTRILDDYSVDSENGMVLGPLRVENVKPEVLSVTSSLCAPITFVDGTEGLIFARLDVTRMVESVASDMTSGKTGYAWVIDETGLTIYHPVKDFIGVKAFEARRARKPLVSFKQINRIMKDRMMIGEEGTSQYDSWWHRGIKGHMTKLIAFSPLKSSLLAPGQVWSIAVAAPISEIAHEVGRVYTRHMGALTALVAGILLFSLILVIYLRHTSHELRVRVTEKESYISSLLQNSVDAIVFIDNDNKVQVWNKGAESIFGYTTEEMLGQTFHRLIPSEKDAEKELNKIMEKVLQKGFIKNYSAKRITKDGQRITVDISRTLIRSNDGEIIGSTAIIKDITEKMELEQRIYNTEKLASIGTLAAGVAHEINNPLAVILGFTDLLLEKYEPGSPEYEDLKIIEINANNAKKIVENLLGFARITEGMEDIVDVNASLQTVLTIMKNTLMTKKIEWELEVPDALPKVKGDTREFQQVIFNLFNNAVAALGDKGGILKLSAWAEDSWVHVSVEDNGVGIPHRIKSHIFDPFFTTKKVGEGTGLGLSLCYGILNKYGGKISFKSSSLEDHPDRPSGTIFIVTMPVKEDEEL